MTDTPNIELIDSNYVNCFNNDPNEFIKFINSPIPIIIISEREADELYLPRAFASTESGAIFGGFPLTDAGLTEEENLEFSKILNESDALNKTSLTFSTGKVVNLSKAFVVATIKVGEKKYDIEKAQWTLNIDTIIEIGDFKSEQHMMLTAGSFILNFDSELQRSNAIIHLSNHHKESYDMVATALKSKIDEGLNNQ